MVLQFLVKTLEFELCSRENFLDFVDQPTSGSAESCNQAQEFQLQNLDKA